MENKHKQFKPFDKVLVRDAFTEWKWHCDIYSHWNEDSKNHSSVILNFIHNNNILPYEGNEHLVGTTDEPEEEIELKEGEYIVCFDEIKHYLSVGTVVVAKFTIIDNDLFYVYDSAWKYAIRFSDFNPNDMEKTKKHIMCVKNGKVVRYKE